MRHVYAVPGEIRRVVDPLEVELYVVESHQMWVLRTDPGSSARAASVLKPRYRSSLSLCYAVMLQKALSKCRADDPCS